MKNTEIEIGNTIGALIEIKNCRRVGLRFEQIVKHLTRKFYGLNPRDAELMTMTEDFLSNAEYLSKKYSLISTPIISILTKSFASDGGLSRFEKRIVSQGTCKRAYRFHNIRSCYRRDEYISVSRNRITWETMRLNDMPFDDEPFKFMVPQPMIAAMGVNKKGIASPRCYGNASPKLRYLVVDFKGDANEQFAGVAFLEFSIPLVLAFMSDHNEIQAWFYVENLTESEQAEMADLAFVLGAKAVFNNRIDSIKIPSKRELDSKVYGDHSVWNCFFVNHRFSLGKS